MVSSICDGIKVRFARLFFTAQLWIQVIFGAISSLMMKLWIPFIFGASLSLTMKLWIQVIFGAIPSLTMKLWIQFIFGTILSLAMKLWIQVNFGAISNLIVKLWIQFIFGAILVLIMKLWIKRYFGACLYLCGATADFTGVVIQKVFGANFSLGSAGKRIHLFLGASFSSVSADMIRLWIHIVFGAITFTCRVAVWPLHWPLISEKFSLYSNLELRL